MAFVLAIEPDPRQAALLRRVLREQVRADLAVVDSKDAAIAALAERVPDLILLTALLSPGDEDELVACLRRLDEAAHIQTLRIPLLAEEDGTRGRSRPRWLGLFKRQADGPRGCAPEVFADQVRTYLEHAAAVKAERAATAPPRADLVPSPTPSFADRAAVAYDEATFRPPESDELFTTAPARSAEGVGSSSAVDEDDPFFSWSRAATSVRSLEEPIETPRTEEAWERETPAVAHLSAVDVGTEPNLPPVDDLVEVSAPSAPEATIEGVPPSFGIATTEKDAPVFAEDRVLLDREAPPSLTREAERLERRSDETLPAIVAAPSIESERATREGDAGVSHEPEPAALIPTLKPQAREARPAHVTGRVPANSEALPPALDDDTEALAVEDDLEVVAVVDDEAPPPPALDTPAPAEAVEEGDAQSWLFATIQSLRRDLARWRTRRAGEGEPAASSTSDRPALRPTAPTPGPPWEALREDTPDQPTLAPAGVAREAGTSETEKDLRTRGTVDSARVEMASATAETSEELRGEPERISPEPAPTDHPIGTHAEAGVLADATVRDQPPPRRMPSLQALRESDLRRLPPLTLEATVEPQEEWLASHPPALVDLLSTLRVPLPIALITSPRGVQIGRVRIAAPTRRPVKPIIRRRRDHDAAGLA